MSLINDQRYLRERQYTTSNNLTARADLHRRFSTNSHGWSRWVFDQLDLHSGMRVLEAGGGPGWLWRENRARFPEPIVVVESDFSLGMAREAQRALASGSFHFANLDVQAIPFADNCFDLAIANHMLYHVPDVPRGLRELARVLRPGGRLIAATNGEAHLQEMHELIKEFEPRYPGRHPGHSAALFGLENGPFIVAEVFSRVDVRRYEDALWITDARPLTEYVRSLWDVADFLDVSRVDALNHFLQTKIALAGGIHITKDSGLILATKPG